MTKIPSVEEWKLRVEALHPTSFCNAHDIDEMNWEHDKKGTIEMIEEALTAERAAGAKDSGVAEERRKHCCCVIKDSQVIESCKMHADIAAAEREAGREEERANIPVSFLRLWINEDRKQPHQELVTNEDIMRFINIGYGK